MILLTIVALLIVYTVTAFIRRKLVKPNYSGQIIWITGASSGLGEYLTYEFNRLGAYVIISARNKKQLERVKKQCTFSENVEVVLMDMIEYEKVRLITQKVLKKLQDKGQKLDMVIQNAGLSMRCEFIHYSFQNHKNLFEINVNGPYNHLQAILPHFIKHKGGKIVGVTSLAGKISTAFRSSYAGSKHAFIGILDSLRCEFRQYNIKVCNLMPGYVRTNLSKNAFAGKTGEKFGKTDLNIQNGMDPAKFARQSVGAIYLDQNEISVSETWLHILGLIFRNLIPDLTFYLQYKNSINQARAVSEAKTQ